MNYNLIVIISLLISGIISYVLSYYGSLVLLDENSGLFKVSQLIIAIVCLSTLYAPIKTVLLKYIDIDDIEGKEK